MKPYGNKRREFHAFVPQTVDPTQTLELRLYGNKCREFHAFVPVSGGLLWGSTLGVYSGPPILEEQWGLQSGDLRAGGVQAHATKFGSCIPYITWVTNASCITLITNITDITCISYVTCVTYIQHTTCITHVTYYV